LLAFRERTPEAEAAFPLEIYRFRSKEEVTDLLRAAGLGSTTLSVGPSPDLWVAEARRG
jgi:hypothetical protein